MARKAFTEHQHFIAVSRVANDAVLAAAEKCCCLSELGSFELHSRTDRIVDDLTRLLLASLDQTNRRVSA
jgi:hypothetical protein